MAKSPNKDAINAMIPPREKVMNSPKMFTISIRYNPTTWDFLLICCGYLVSKYKLNKVEVTKKAARRLECGNVP